MSELTDWIESRTPPAPAALLEHLVAGVAGVAGHARGVSSATSRGRRNDTDAPTVAGGNPTSLPATAAGNPTSLPATAHEALLVAADASLDRVLASGAATRDSALDLLSADAFVTYAFEAAADEPGSVSVRADEAMRRISDRAVTFLNRP